MIYLGTTGWTHAHWDRSFYPADIENRIAYYGSHSLLTEIDTTFYHIPSRGRVEAWFQSSPEDFIFSAKMLKEITHSPDLTVNSELLEIYFEHMAALGKKLRIVLLELPSRTRRTKRTVKFVSGLIETCSSMFEGTIALEVKHKSWLTLDMHGQLPPCPVTLVTTDAFPDVVSPRSSEIHYIRLLGDQQTVPDHMLGMAALPRSEELGQWADKLASLNSDFGEIFVLLSDRFSGDAIRDARRLSKLLQRQGVETRGFETQRKQVTRKRLDVFLSSNT